MLKVSVLLALMKSGVLTSRYEAFIYTILKLYSYLIMSGETRILSVYQKDSLLILLLQST